MTRDALLVAHIALGVGGLLLGPAALLARGGLRRPVRIAYLLAVTGVSVTSAGLAATAFGRLWWLLPFAVGTHVAAVSGVLAWRRRRPGWPTACAHLLGGTYVALVTGALVVSTGNPVFWILPALLAQWPIAVAKRRLAAPARALASA